MTTQSDLLERVTVRTDVSCGKPIIRDMRIAVERILAMLAAGDTVETITDECPDLTTEDIQACLSFARLSPACEHVCERASPSPTGIVKFLLIDAGRR